MIDLRGPFERRLPHPLEGATTEVVSLPLMNSASLARLARLGDATPELSSLYVEIVRTQGRALAQIAITVAHAPAPVLVHCSAGKDRTGITIAVLLSALDVAPEVVLGDFAATDPNMPGVIRRLGDGSRIDVARLARDHPRLFLAEVPAMQAMLDEVSVGALGSADWLIAHGLSSNDLKALRRRLVESVG